MLLYRGLWAGLVVASLLIPGELRAQQAPPSQTGGMAGGTRGGIAAGVGAAPVYDEQKRAPSPPAALWTPAP